MKKPSDRLGVKIVWGLKETSTAWAGASLLVDLFRRLEMGEAADRVLAPAAPKPAAQSGFPGGGDGFDG